MCSNPIPAPASETARPLPRRTARAFPLVGLFALAALVLPQGARAEANYVYHVRDGTDPGCGGQYVTTLNPSSAQTYALRIKVEYQNYTDTVRVYYTTDGTTPSGAFGTGGGTTLVVPASFVCTFGSPVVDVWTATIPAQPAGTVVKYIVSAWHSMGGAEIFGNGPGAPCSCGTPTSSSALATVQQYTVGSTTDLYWDSNGATAGAGATPTGTWGTSAFWSSVFDGTAATGAWVTTRNAVFSAGTDANGAFTITTTSAQTAAGLTIEEGTVSLAGNAVNVGTGSITVNSGATLSIDSTSRLGAAGGGLNLNGGKMRQTNPGSAGSFVNAATGIKIGAAGGTVEYSPAGAAVPANSNTIYAGTITGVGNTLTKTGPGEFRYQGTGLPNTTYAKLVVKEGLFRLGFAASTSDERGFGAVPASPTSDSITISNGASIGTSFGTTTHANRGITLGEGGGGFNTSASSFTIGGGVTGTGTLFKNTAGTLTLIGANNYDGNTMISGGVISVGSATALGSTVGHTEVASGAEVLFTGAATTFTCAEPIRIAGPGGSDAGAIAVIASASPTLSGPITLIGDATITVSSSASATFNNPAAITSLANQNLTLQGGANSTGVKAITGVINLGSGGLTKLQSGEWVLSGANVYSGPTTISAGTLRVANSTGSATGSGAVTVASGATLAGSGIIAGSVSVTGTIAAGSSPGTITTGDEIWNGGGAYAWEINDAAGTAGANPGWDLVNITGTLTISATPGSKFNVNVRSLTLANAIGDAANFDNSLDYVWTIATASGGISGFDATAFNLNTTTFSNAVGSGLFLLEQAGNDIRVRFVHPPAIAVQPADTSAECGLSNATFSVTATGTVPLGFQWRHAGTNLPGANAATLTISPATSDTAGSYDVLVGNAYGSVASAVATLTVTDTTPPVFNCGQNETVTCMQGWGFTFPIITDNCDGLISGNGVPISTTTNFTCGYTFVATRIWQVTDSSANTTYCTQVVTYVDFIPSTITDCPTNLTVQCLGDVPAPDISSVTATNQFDPCETNPPVVAHFSDVTNGVCPKVITRTYRAYDACSNYAQCVQTITVQDTTPPVFVNCPPPTLNLGCNPASIPDCDPNVGATDNCGLATLPANLLVSRGYTDEVKRYNGTTGAFIDNFASGGGLDQPYGMAFGPDGNLYVSSFNTDSVKRYHGTTGAFIDTFASGGGLSQPYDLVFGLDGNLYVSSFNTDSVKRYHGTTGAFIDNFASGGGLDGPFGLVFGPDGKLYVSSYYTSEVKRYNGTTGAFIDTFVSSPGLGGAGGLVFGPDGNLYVSGFGSDNVDRFNGTTGAPMGVFASGNGLDGSYGLAFGSDGNLYVVSFYSHAVKRYNGTTGAFIDTIASGALDGPTSLIFTPLAPAITCARVDTTNGCARTRTLTYTAVDACNNSNTCTQVITWTEDTTPPLVNCGQNETLEYGLSWDFTVPSISDNCDASPALAILSTVTNQACGNTFTATRVWQVADACTNVTYCTQVVTVVDHTPPVIACAADKNAECASAWSFDRPTANDTSDGTNVTIAVLGTVTNAGPCGGAFTATRTWSATDQCGNSNTCSQTVTVIDTTPPTLNCPAQVTFGADGTSGMVTFTVTATDACQGAVTPVCAPPSGSTFNAGTTPVTCRANDACGNTNTCTFNVIVTDISSGVIYADDDWVGLADGTEVAPGRTIGVNAFGELPAAINAANPGGTVRVSPGSYHGTTVGKTLLLDASGGGVVITGASPALTLTAGTLNVNGGTLTTATDDPTVLVTGGTLVLRNATVEESTGFDQVALKVTGGTVDLGTTASAGNNVVNIKGAGSLVRSEGATPVSAIGNTWQDNGVAITSNFAIEDEIFHALDAGGGALVTYVANNVYVTLNSGSIQRGVDAVAAGDTVNVDAGAFSENVTVPKRLTLNGAGSGTGAGDTIVTAANAALPVILIDDAGGTGAGARLAVKNLRATGSTGSDGIKAQATTAARAWYLFDNVAAVNNVNGAGIGLEGPDDLSDVEVSGCVLDGNNTGLRLATSIHQFRRLTVTGGQMMNNNTAGLGVNGSGTDATDANTDYSDITVDGTAFANNDTGLFAGGGHLSFFRFNGNATVKNVTMMGATWSPIQFRGEGVDANPLTWQPAGTVLLQNVTIGGSGIRPGVYIQDYSDVTGFSFDTVGLGGYTPPDVGGPNGFFAQAMQVRHTGAAKINLGKITLPCTVAFSGFTPVSGYYALAMSFSGGAQATCATVILGAATPQNLEDCVFDQDDAALAAAIGFPPGLPGDVMFPALSLSACPANIVKECTGGGSAVATWIDPTVAAADCPPASVTCSPASGSSFTVAGSPHLVTCTATDARGLSVSCSFSVTVQDTNAPTIMCPPDVHACSASGAAIPVNFTVTAMDACDAAPTITCDHNSGDSFPVGATLVTCTAKDASLNTSAPCSFNVVVHDTSVTPTVVYVDDGYVGLANCTLVDWPYTGSGPHLIGYDAFAAVQGGIAAVASGGTVNVAAGSYAENVILSKRVNLLGAKNGVDARGRVTGAPDPAVESILTPANPASSTLELQGGGCAFSVIDGLVFSGGNNLGVIRLTTNPADGLQILNNHIAGFTGSALFLDKTSIDTTVARNVIDGSNLAGSGQLVFLDGADSFPGFELLCNWIQNGSSRSGLFVDGNRNVRPSANRPPRILQNLFANQTNNVGINMGSRSFDSGVIAMNTFTNNGFDGLQGGPKDSLIVSNLFVDNLRWGLSLTSFGNTGAGRGATNDTITCNTFLRNGFGTAPIILTNLHGGILFSATQPAGNNASHRVNFNNFSGNSTGAVYTGTETVNLENNWWGSPTGPAHASNPGGTGDAVVGNTIDFVPFLTQDTSFPNVVCPASFTVITAPGQCTAAVTFAASAASGCCGGSITLVCVPPSGSVFAIGTNAVTCAATNDCGKSASCSFTITVRDGDAPMLTCSTNRVVECAGPAGTPVTFVVTVSDICDTNPTLVCSHSSGDLFPLGVTMVNCTATDASGNMAACNFTVTVQDTIAPALNCPTNIFVTTTNLAGEVVNYTVTATDVCNPTPAVNCAPLSGSLFPPGATPVQCTASDGNGNSNSCSFTVNVNRAPTARDNGAGTTQNRAVVVPFGKLLYNDSDPDGDTLTVSAVTALSTNGGSVVISNQTVVYTPALNFFGVDRFSYTASDGRGGFDTADVEVFVADGSLPGLNQVSSEIVPGGVRVRFAGIPGYTYDLQRAPTVTGPWATIATRTAPLHGIIEYLDANPPSPSFYRTVQP